MGDKDKNINWEPDIKEGMETIKDIKKINKELTDDFGRRKIDGFNPYDVGKKK